MEYHQYFNLVGGLLFLLSIAVSFAVAFRARSAGLTRSNCGELGGVCCGIARHFDIATWLVKAVVIVVTVFVPFGGYLIIQYVVLCGVLPKEKRPPVEMPRCDGCGSCSCPSSAAGKSGTGEHSEPSQTNQPVQSSEPSTSD